MEASAEYEHYTEGCDTEVRDQFHLGSSYPWSQWSWGHRGKWLLGVCISGVSLFLIRTVHSVPLTFWPSESLDYMRWPVAGQLRNPKLLPIQSFSTNCYGQFWSCNCFLGKVGAEMVSRVFLFCLFETLCCSNMKFYHSTIRSNLWWPKWT